MAGKAGNPRASDLDSDRRSIDYDAGSYVRGEDHDGDAAPRAEKEYHGLELETMTMTANAPGVPADYPLLTLAVGVHNPGKIKLAGQRLLQELQRHKYPVGHAACDRAHMPGAIAEELQGPFLDAGYRTVFDYGLNHFGLKSQHEHAILVMGSWYVLGMPTALIEAETLHAKALTALHNGTITSRAGIAAALVKLLKSDPQLRVIEPELNAIARAAAATGTSEAAVAAELLKDRRHQRGLYRLKRKGRRRPDGSQQYFYPDPTTYIIVNETTGEIDNPLSKSTVVIPREAGLKYAQYYVHGSAEWQGWYSLRNTVEGSYAHAKNVAAEDLGNPAKRRKRGRTFAFLAMALMIVSANVRKLIDWVIRNHSDGRRATGAAVLGDLAAK